jgi:hypothetical protein
VSLSKHRDQLAVSAARQFVRRIPMVFLDDHLVRVSRNLPLDSFAHQETGKQPFEQPGFVRTLKVDL